MCGLDIFLAKLGSQPGLNMQSAASVRQGIDRTAGVRLMLGVGSKLLYTLRRKLMGHLRVAKRSFGKRVIF